MDDDFDPPSIIDQIGAEMADGRGDSGSDSAGRDIRTAVCGGEADL